MTEMRRSTPFPSSLRFLPAGLVLVAGALAFVPAPAAAQTGTACRSTASVEVRVAFHDVSLTYDYGRSIAQLAAMPGRSPGPAGAARGYILGLSLAEHDAKWQVEPQVQQLGDGSACVGPRVVTVTFGYDKRVIYVAREVPQGSCLFGEVVNHELKHVATDDQWLKEFAPTLKQRLERALAQAQPVRVRSLEQGKNAIRQPTDAVMRQMMADFGRERARRQSLVDTAAEYDRVSRSCNGEAGRYIPKGRGEL